MSFNIFAPQNERSMIRKNTVRNMDIPRPHFQMCLIAVNASMVVIPIVDVTAMPYAAARFPEVLKLSISPTVQTKSSQFILGMYICPLSLSDVCRTLILGRYPSCRAWNVNENAPEMTACEAITVAKVASITRGYKAHCGAR